MLLAPALRVVPETFTQVQADNYAHAELLSQIQEFRGRIYLQDGAVKPWQLVDGKHRTESDQGSWHLLVLDSRDGVCGCARYKQYPFGASYENLTASKCALAFSKDWGEVLRGAVEAELALARQRQVKPSEWGGWALGEEVRGSAEALRMTLAAYALTQALGGGVAFSCVTRRHGSASILRRMGGRALECGGLEIPPYYDPQYECEMELLSFRSWAPNARYSAWVEEIGAGLRGTPVLTTSHTKYLAPPSSQAARAASAS